MEKASALAENPSPVSETGLRFSAKGLKNPYNHFVQHVCDVMQFRDDDARMRIRGPLACSKF